VNPTLNATGNIAKARSDVRKAGLKVQVVNLVCMVTGGPREYIVKGMKEAHANYAERMALPGSGRIAFIGSCAHSTELGPNSAVSRLAIEPCSRSADPSLPHVPDVEKIESIIDRSEAKSLPERYHS
jgi:hypothetical protein